MRTKNDLDYGKPISPNEIREAKAKVIPPEVIEVVNKLIAVHWDGQSAQFKRDDVIDGILEEMTKPNLTRSDIFDNHWLEFEEVFKRQGWTIDADRPGFNETYTFFYVFTKKKLFS